MKTFRGLARTSIKTFNGIDTTSGGGGTPPVAGYSIWLAADNIVGLSNSDPVPTWADASGNGYDQTQATSANQPIYETAQLNGLPVVTFDGTNDVLSGSRPSLTDYTLFMVLKAISPVNFTGPYVLEKDVHDGLYLPNFFVRAGGGLINTGESFSSAYRILSVVVSGSTADVYVDGSASGTNTAASPGGTSLEIGAASNSSYGHQSIAEFILYSSALGTTDRQSDEAYLATKYGL